MTNQADLQNEAERTQTKSAPSAWSIFATASAVLLSSAIAFCCTCYPLGNKAFRMGLMINQTQEQIEQSNEQLIFAFWTGFIVAVIAGCMVFFFIRKSRSKQ